MHRRRFLGSAGLGLAAMGLPSLGLPRRAMAAAPGQLKFIFVFNVGGWDPTRVFADAFDRGGVDMEADAERASAGNISYVDHPARPSVRSFFEAHHDRTLVLNGVQVRSIAHDICTMIAMTGSTSGLEPDWPAILAYHGGAGLTLPHLVLGGPSFPGDFGTSVARTGAYGQLEALISGEIIGWSDLETGPLSSPARGAIDDYIARRAAGRLAGAGSSQDEALARAFQESVEKSRGLKDYRYLMDFTGGADLSSQARVAVDALELGLSRCVTLGYAGANLGSLGWDSHADNDATQSALFEGLFGGLGPMMELLEAAPGESGGSLADETVVVVFSEMGRTAQLNDLGGKDHWPYTSVMITGPRITGDRVIGGFDDGYAGLLIDPSSAEPDDGGGVLSVESIGAALLSMADVDPEAYVSGAEPLWGMLA